MNKTKSLVLFIITYRSDFSKGQNKSNLYIISSPFHMRQFYVYILTNKYHSTLYIGVTNNLIRRLAEHRSNRNSCSFTNRYNLYKLIYFESTFSIMEAIAREKALKNWKKVWKWNLIKEMNPLLKDLSLDWE